MRHSAPIELMRVLSVQRDLSLGNLASSRVVRLRTILAAAAVRFQPGATYTEAGVNDLLRRFLAGAGSMLAADHVELRRWLVDLRLLHRDGFGHRYVRGEPPPEFAPLLQAFEGVDLDTLAAEAQAADAIERAARRARWEQRQGGAS